MTQLPWVRGVILADVGDPPSGLGRLSDGQTVGETGAPEPWLLAGSGPTRGTYTVFPDGTWTRREAVGSFSYGDEVLVRGGDEYRDSAWRYYGEDDVAPGGDVYFELASYGRPAFAGSGFDQVGANIVLPEREESDGVSTAATLTIERGLVVGVEPGLISEDFISGFALDVAASGGVLVATAAPGQAWIPALERVVSSTQVLEARSPLAGGSWPAFALLHAYLAVNAGRPALEVVQIPPDDAYYGDAMTLGGAAPDDGRRFLGGYITSGAGALFSQRFYGDDVYYLFNSTVNSRVVENAVATATQPVNLVERKMVPRGTRLAYLRVTTNATAGVGISNPESFVLPTNGSGIRTLRPGQDVILDVQLDGAGAFNWANGQAGGSTNMEVVGYRLRR